MGARMKSWIFVVNVEKYPPIISEWKGQQATGEWVVRQHRSKLKNATGDTVYIYLAGAGIIAKARISGPAYPCTSTAGWAEDARDKGRGVDQVPLTFERWLGEKEVISWRRLQEILSSDSAFLRANANGTNFLLSEPDSLSIEAEWKQWPRQ